MTLSDHFSKKQINFHLESIHTKCDQWLMNQYHRGIQVMIPYNSFPQFATKTQYQLNTHLSNCLTSSVASFTEYKYNMLIFSVLSIEME